MSIFDGRDRRTIIDDRPRRTAQGRTLIGCAVSGMSEVARGRVFRPGGTLHSLWDGALGKERLRKFWEIEWRREVGLEGGEVEMESSLGDLDRERKVVFSERNGGMLYILAC